MTTRESARDQAYDFYVDCFKEPPYFWEEGVEVSPAEYPLHFMARMFNLFVEKGKGRVTYRRRPEGMSVDDWVVTELTYDPASDTPRELWERTSTTAMNAGLADRRPRAWTTLLCGLPNPSGIAWAHAPGDDYAGATYIPAQPKKFLKAGRVEGILIVPVSTEFLKVFQELSCTK